MELAKAKPPGYPEPPTLSFLHGLKFSDPVLDFRY
jgi:hypothetical protein